MKNKIIKLLAIGLLMAMLFTTFGCTGTETPDEPNDSDVQQGGEDSDSDSDSDSGSDSESDTEQQLSEKELRRLRTIEFITYNIAFYDWNYSGGFNVYYDGQTASDYAISKRQERLKIFVEHYSPDVLALQEVNHIWWPYLITNEDSLLNKMGYEYTGNMSAYRQKDGKGTIDNELYNLLFWNPEKFDLVKQGHFWLTSNGRPVSGNADKSRMCTWAILKNKDTGFETLYASTHFVTGGNLDSKNESLNKKMGEILTATLTEAAEGRPIVVGGDYNMNQESPSYKYITGEGGFIDSKYKGKTRLNINMTSMRSWGANKSSYSSSGNPIDHVFFKGDLIIDKWSMLPDTVNANGKVSSSIGGNNYDISDHLGIYVKVREPDPVK